MRTTDPLNFHTSHVNEGSKIGVPNQRPIKFREMLPMQIKDKVSGKGLRQNEKACLGEMMQLFICFTKKDFETNGCPKEIAEFESCWQNHLNARSQLKAQNSAGALVAGQRVNDMTTAQVNTLLKKYPVQQFIKKVRW